MRGLSLRPLKIVTLIVVAAAVFYTLNQLSDTEASSFNPSIKLTISDTTASTGHPDHEIKIDVPVGDANLAGAGAALVTFLPPAWCIASHDKDCSSVTGTNTADGPAVPTGVIVGPAADNDSGARLALQTPSGSLNGSCNNLTVVEFEMLEAEPNEDAGTIDTDPGGFDIFAPLLVRDDGLPRHSTLWPSYLSSLLDPVEGTGANSANIVFPRARYSGDDLVAGNAVVLNILVFNPGDLLAFNGQPWASFTAAKGFPLLTVLQDPQQANNISIADFCSDLETTITILGTTLTNTAPTTDIPGGSVLHQNASATSGIGNTGTQVTRFFTQSDRDLDFDTYENDLDTCPNLANADGDPRSNMNGTDNDGSGPNGDGIDSVCDPTPTLMTQWDKTNDEDGEGANTCDNGIDDGASDGLIDILDPDCHDTVNQTSGGLDIDGDGWANLLDNCPLVENDATQSGLDVDPDTAVSDGGPANDFIGSACDSSPTTADGHFHEQEIIGFVCNGAADTDGDGWCDARETGVGTGINKPCATTKGISNRNDEGDDGIPVDFNDDGAVNLPDRGLMIDAVLEFAETKNNIPRFDLDQSGAVNIFDRAAVVASIGFTC